MQYKLLWCTLTMTTLLACRNNEKPQEQGYALTGTLKGIDTGTVKLMAYDEDTRKSTPVDSGVVKDHQFTLKGKVGTPQMMSLVITPGNWHIPVFMEDTVLAFTADTTGSEYYDYSAYGYDKGAMVKTFTETGSRNNDDWMRYQKDPGQHQFDTALAVLRRQYDSAKGNIDSQYKIRDKMSDVYKSLQVWQKNWINDYIAQHPSSVAGIYMFSQLYRGAQDYPASDLDSTLKKFSGQATASIYYKPLETALAKKKAVLPGSVAPDFTLLKRDSTPFSLSSLRGHYTMIDFWASWCHPCREAIPHWKKVYTKYHDKGFEMVSVSDDNKWPAWFKALDAEKMPWNQVCDEFPVKDMPARVGSLYMTTYIPFYVLLDKDGKILVYSGKEEEIDNKLKEVFGS